MEKVLNYTFNRRSNTYLEWLYEVIKSEKYFQSDSIILPREMENKNKKIV